MSSSIETLVAKIKTFPAKTQRGISALLGATVADAATRPLHWVYNQETLDEVIGNCKEPEFWPESKSPFYTIPLGNRSGYNDVALVSLRSLNESNRQLDITHLCESFKKHFGAGSDYADALSRRKIAYDSENRSEFRGPIDGPWIQKAVMLFLENYEKGQTENLGDSENKEFDGLCASLPIIAQHAGKENMWSTASKVTSLLSTNVEISKMFHTAALLLSNYIMGVGDPLAQVKETIQSLYPNVYELINEVEEAKSSPFITTVAKLGKACYLPGSLQGALLAMLQTTSYVDAVRLNITAGGCSCGRSNLIGACYGAKDGIDGIPIEWLQKVNGIERIMEMAIDVLTE